jgi:hypothetical protein
MTSPASPSASHLLSSSIPQKRPAQTSTDDTPRPRPNPKNAHREPREKKDSWRKKEATGGSGVAPATSSSHDTTPKASLDAIPGLVRYRLPAPKFQDYFGHPAPPIAPAETSETPGEWFAVNDQLRLPLPPLSPSSAGW